MLYLCSPLEINANVAQLVEHDLAKVGVAGSSLVIRSRSFQKGGSFLFCSGGGIGRHAGLRATFEIIIFFMAKNKWAIKDRIDDKLFIEVCNRSLSMSQAAAELGLHFNSFKKRAIELGCYRPNKAGIGVRKNMPKIPINDIIVKGLHPNYQSYKLKNRLIDEGIKVNQCEECGIEQWNNKSLKMELHHINGDRTDHQLENLKLLCPNCHSQTDNFRAKNKSN